MTLVGYNEGSLGRCDVLAVADFLQVLGGSYKLWFYLSRVSVSEAVTNLTKKYMVLRFEVSLRCYLGMRSFEKILLHLLLRSPLCRLPIRRHPLASFSWR